MIEYLEIINKIKDVKEECIEDFNKNVSIPLALSNLDSKIKYEDDNIVIEKNGNSIILDLETRKVFTEIIYILKKIDVELYDKIDYKYIDFFEKFKDTNYNFEFDSFDKVELKYLSVEILTIFNLKFWCIDNDDKKSFLDNLKPKVTIEENIEPVEENTEVIQEESQIIKTSWWINFVNKVRNIIKK